MQKAICRLQRMLMADGIFQLIILVISKIIRESILPSLPNKDDEDPFQGLAKIFISFSLKALFYVSSFHNLRADHIPVAQCPLRLRRGKNLCKVHRFQRLWLMGRPTYSINYVDSPPHIKINHPLTQFLVPSSLSQVHFILQASNIKITCNSRFLSTTLMQQSVSRKRKPCDGPVIFGQV